MKGKIIKLENGVALVELERTNACKGCGLCLAGKDSKKMFLNVKALSKTKIGEFVNLKINRKMKAEAQLWLLAIPMLIFIFIASISHFLFRFNDSESFVFSVSALLFTYLLIWFLNKKKGWNNEFAASIKKSDELNSKSP
jgi:positive regulator of sigma E activity